MRNIQSSSAGGYSEFFERREKAINQFEAGRCKAMREGNEVAIDALIDRGFTWEEAAGLVSMREHLYENAEMRQRMAEDCRMQFVKWLREHGQMFES